MLFDTCGEIQGKRGVYMKHILCECNFVLYITVSAFWPTIISSILNMFIPGVLSSTVMSACIGITIKTMFKAKVQNVGLCYEDIRVKEGY